MASETHRAIPSMYHRRLLLLVVAMVVVMLGMSAQLVRLTVVHGATHREDAEAALRRRTFLATWRGNVLDRRGRIIATDEAGYAVSVSFDVITGRWERRQAQTRAREMVGRAAWLELGDEAQERLVDRCLPEYETQVRQLWAAVMQHGGFDEVELHRRLDAIRGRVQRVAAAVEEHQRKRAIEPEEFVFGGIEEERGVHPILERVSDEVAFEFRRLAREMPGMFEVEDARARLYPYETQAVELDRSTLPRLLRRDEPVVIELDGIGRHVLGSMRDVAAGDVAKRPFLRIDDAGRRTYDLGGYRRANDRIGARGIEGALEGRLRGARGEILARLDRDEEVRTAPAPGGDVHVTLDIELQARVEAIMSHDFGLTRVQPWHENDALPPGYPLNGAAVVLEVATGDVLAMATVPRWPEGLEMDAFARAVNAPFVNRPVEAIYQPGSIAKPIVLTAAIEEGLHGYADTIECRGYFGENPEANRCWIFRPEYGFATHGEQAARGAIARSCNVFFFTLGERLGDRLPAWYRRFGVGAPFEIGLRHRVETADGGHLDIGENGGTVPQQVLDYEARQMGIGQGPVAWTPLHAANAYATLARGGARIDPVLVEGVDRAEAADVPIGAAVRGLVMDGLHECVTARYGSASGLRYPDGSKDPFITAGGVRAWAKTGTAQTTRPLHLADLDGDGRPTKADGPVSGLANAWFVCLVGPAGGDMPLYAIAVVVEFAGSGGRVSGPIANQIVLALQAEGYLPEGELALADVP